jgi:uncharacterized cupredoxin-like copper-binding protein
MRSKPILPISAIALAAAAVASGCGNSSSADSGNPKPTGSGTPAAAAPTTGPVKTTLSEFKIQPAATTAAGPKTSFDVTNSGKTTHELVVLKTDKQAADLGKGSRVPETNNVGEIGDLKPGASKKLTLKLKPGHYALICNLPGHYMAGMHADFTVK